MLHYQPGRYRCRVDDQGWQESKTGKPMIVFKVTPLCLLVPGPEGTDEQQVNGEYDRTIRVVVDSKSEKGMEFALKKLRYAGFTGESFADLDLVGSEVECKCEPRQYEGKDVEQWELALPPFESKPLVKMDSKVARKLDTLFGKKLKDGAAKAEPKRETVPNDIPPEDDVPF